MNVAMLRAMLESMESDLASLPADSDAAIEAGRIFSAKNETQLRAAVQALNALLAQVSLPPDAPGQAPVPGQPPQVAAPPVAAVPVVQRQAADAPAEAIAQEGAVALSEAAVKDGKSLIKVITAGWGSSGFYSPAVLERDAPIAFPKGTKMFWDHPTVDDKRPERSLRDLAAELTEDARWLATGPEGPGVYSRAKIFAAYQPAVEELAPHMGVSIRASAMMKQGEAEGRKGPIVDRLLASPTNSVDFVTIPGRGGRVSSLFEAARGANTTQEDDVSEAETKAAIERAEKAERERDAALLVLAQKSAKEVATEAVGKVDLPAAARNRIVESATREVPMKDGVLDADTLTETVTKAATEERAYIDQITGRGTVRGMGSGATEAAAKPEDMASAFQRLGLSESASKTAASGRR